MKKRITLFADDDEKVEFTERQLLVLNFMAHGFTNAEIAVILKVSVRAIESERYLITKKCGARNSFHALTISVAKGIVNYAPEKYKKYL